MKKLNLILVFFTVLLVISNSSCKKNKTEPCYSNEASGRIIGFDPCREYATFGKVNGAGFVIERTVNGVKDTVACYDMPENLYSFQPTYLGTGYSSFLFEPTTQNLFKIKFSFRELGDNEKTIFVCLPLVYSSDFNRAVKGKQIKITCINKL
jgi:hypothetical protein